MNLIKFLRDLVIWLSNHYSQLPDEFKKQFPEETLVNARSYMYDVCDYDSEVNQDFVDYE